MKPIFLPAGENGGRKDGNNAHRSAREYSRGVQWYLDARASKEEGSGIKDGGGISSRTREEPVCATARTTVLEKRQYLMNAWSKQWPLRKKVSGLENPDYEYLETYSTKEPSLRSWSLSSHLLC